MINHLEKLLKLIEEMRDRRLDEILCVLTLEVERTFTDMPVGTYIKTIEFICANDDARISLKGCSQVNMAISFYIAYAKPRNISTNEVLRKFSREKKSIYNARKRIAKAYELAKRNI